MKCGEPIARICPSCKSFSLMIWTEEYMNGDKIKHFKTRAECGICKYTPPARKWRLPEVRYE